MTSESAGIRRLVNAGVRDRVYPGAVWAVGDARGTRATGAGGTLDPLAPIGPFTRGDNRTRGRVDVRMNPNTIFDVASLTKIIAVWACVGALWEDGVLPLDAPLASYWPEVAGHPLGDVTARRLLTHTAGVPPHADLALHYGTDPDTIRTGVLREVLHRPPGEAVEYTDRAALILGYLVEHLAADTLDHVAGSRIWQPLGMRDTRFGPLPTALGADCAPTEPDPDSGGRLRGTVHDPSARLLGGVCGIAGAFTVRDDLARFLRHLLGAPPADRGPAPGFGPAWVEESLTVHTGDLEPARGLFWHPAPGTHPAEGVYVHYGFTGTAMWISARRRRWAVLLTNKVYFTREREPLAAIRNEFRRLAFG
ncbi:serine hydrolase domain-containing protein [Embleya scabrispora]|uniref:serine hydrolase domain-containing protein n=1 Tax=Embleya scabrispora TaxID=159449 RepID=UPI00037B7496|nr:serine hydrolase domain-containing protein [Embleya scabrispora]MYS82669.1 serine hydrolase [Streptomyces sp. SID5474]